MATVGAVYEPPASSPCPDDVPDGGAYTGSGLGPEQIRSVVMANIQAFQGCYEAEPVKERNLQGGVAFSFRIGVDGIVQCISVSSSSLRNANVERCMLERFQALKFPASGKPTAAVFPFMFKGIR